ncbi:MAG TPA: MerR family transcriptional regulator, partial [Acidimicrobiales bacterium]|nr:MerR family transcriptional regulator [Acidimicrobiales bacterium]
KRSYSYQDIVELKVVKQLLDAGVNLQKARTAIHTLREAGEDLATANLVLSGENSILIKSDEGLMDLLRGGQGVFNVVPLAGVVDELQAAILSFDDARKSEVVTTAPPPPIARTAEGSSS